MKSTRTIVLTGLLIGIGCVLPPVIRMIPNGGVLFSPMHIPAFLAGLTLGPVSGLIVGILCPILNTFLFGMPQGVTLFAMCVELPVYGVVTGFLLHRWAKKDDLLHVELAIIIAMILGRIAGGLMQSLILGMGTYNFSIWVSSYFIATSPAIVCHLILLPAVYFALKKARIVKK